MCCVLKRPFVWLVAGMLGVVAALPAQQRSGVVTDREGRPIDLATVVLTAGDRQLAAAVTDEAGRFELTAADGEVTLRIRNLAYRAYEKPLVLSAGMVDVGRFVLEPAAVELGEVTVSAVLVERESDRFVMRINNHPAMINKDASEVLRLAPGVWIDDDGVSINGASGAKVYVNDREIRLTGRELTDYIRQFRSADIARVEVVPQADASYSADTRAGVVHIVLRRVVENGLDGTLALAVDGGSNLAAYRPSTTVNARTGRWMLNGALSAQLIPRESSTLTAVRRYRTATGSDFRSLTEMTRRQRYLLGRAGAIFDLDARNELGLSVEWGRRAVEVPSEAKTEMRFGGLAIDGLNRYRQDGTDRNVAAIFNYIHRFDTLGTTLKFIADYTDKAVTGDNDYRSQTFYGSGGIVSDSSSRSRSLSHYRVFMADVAWQKRYGKAFRLSVGAKYTLNTMADTVGYDAQSAGRWQPLAEYSFSHRYAEHIGAIYSTFGAELGRWSLSAGMRGEYTQLRGGARQSYLNLFPSLTATYAFDPMRLFMLVGQYSRSIQRPNFWNLNPSRIYYSDYSYQVGNPQLRPTPIHRFSLTGVYHYRYTLTVGGNLHRDLIRVVTKSDPKRSDVTYVMPENHYAEHHYFVALSAPAKPVRWCEMHLNLVGVRQEIRYLRSDRPAAHYLAFANLTANVSLPMALTFELTYSGNSRLYSANSGVEPRHLVHATLKRSFFDGRLTATAGVNNLFDSRVAYFADIERFRMATEGIDGGSSRFIKCSLQYRFRSGKTLKKRSVESAAGSEKSRIEQAAQEK